MKILICGAGVGGLSLAAGLKTLGHEIEIFEKSDTLRTVGAGLNLWPNSVRAIYGLGLKEDFLSVAVKLNRYIFYSPSGELIHKTETTDWEERYGAPVTGVYRKSLSEMLANAAGYQRINFGFEVVSARNEGDQAVCEFANGETRSGDLVIAADGIYSNIRTSLIGDIPLRKNPHHAYRLRALLNMADVDVDPAAQTGIFAPGAIFSVLPIGNGMGYWFGSVSGATNIDEFIHHFDSWTDSHVPGTLAMTPRESIVESELNDFERLPETWRYGRIALIGDSAHAMMPDLAQGASQTLIDAYELFKAIRDCDDVFSALEQYERVRKPVADHVVNASKRGSFLGKDGVDPIPVRYMKEIETFSSDAATA